MSSTGRDFRVLSVAESRDTDARSNDENNYRYPSFFLANGTSVAIKMRGGRSVGVRSPSPRGRARLALLEVDRSRYKRARARDVKMGKSTARNSSRPNCLTRRIALAENFLSWRNEVAEGIEARSRTIKFEPMTTPTDRERERPTTIGVAMFQ